jgi:hypothetical protein
MAATVQDSKDGVSFTGARTADTINFVLSGGKYVFAVSTPSTSATLSILMPDGTTYQTVDNETAAAFKALDLSPGSYELTFVGTADISGLVQRAPYNPAY